MPDGHEPVMPPKGDELDGLMSFAAHQLVWLYRMVNSDDPLERELAWTIIHEREEVLRTKSAPNR